MSEPQNAPSSPQDAPQPPMRRGPSGAVAFLRSAPARSYGNLVATFRILSARRRRLGAHHPQLHWRVPAFIVLCLTVVCMIALDQPVGSYYAAWGGRFSHAARLMTDVGLGLWYITPGFLILIVANQVDWSRLSRRQLLAAYNWTSLGFLLVVGVGLSLLLINIVKRIIGRARPVHYDEHGAFTFDPFAVDASFASFPSGHSTTSGAAAAVLVLLLPRARFLVLAFFIWIASTRIMAGQHYPSDVIAGFSFGFAFATLTAIVFARLGYMFSLREDGLPRLKPGFTLWPTRRLSRSGRTGRPSASASGGNRPARP